MFSLAIIFLDVAAKFKEAGKSYYLKVLLTKIFDDWIHNSSSEHDELEILHLGGTHYDKYCRAWPSIILSLFYFVAIDIEGSLMVVAVIMMRQKICYLVLSKYVCNCNWDTKLEASIVSKVFFSKSLATFVSSMVRKISLSLLILGFIIRFVVSTNFQLSFITFFFNSLLGWEVGKLRQSNRAAIMGYWISGNFWNSFRFTHAWWPAIWQS